jgi:hypothetical protein
LKAAALLLIAAASASAVELSPKTLKQFQAYMCTADEAMEARAKSKEAFLWSTESAERRGLMRSGSVVIEPWQSHVTTEIHGGLVHDWVSAAFVPGAKIADFVSVIKDFPAYPQVYKPDVLAGRHISHQGDRMRGVMRMHKKNVLTVVLDAEFELEFRNLSPTRYQDWTRSVSIVEVENAGKSNEYTKPADSGYGFLWRLNSYWQVEEADGGIYMECRAISLTRDIPMGLSWAIKPMISTLPKESLQKTLEATRRAVVARAKS